MASVGYGGRQRGSVITSKVVVIVKRRARHDTMITVKVKVPLGTNMRLTTEELHRRFVGLIYQSVPPGSVDLSPQIHRSMSA